MADTFYFAIQYVYDLTICSRSVKNKTSFRDDILKRVLSMKKRLEPEKKNYAGLRCLQYLSIIIFYEIIGFAFVEKYNTINERLCKWNAQHGESPLVENLVFFRQKIFDTFFNGKGCLGFEYQKKSGYTLHIKYLISLCGGDFGVGKVKASTSIKSKKQRVADDKGSVTATNAVKQAEDKLDHSDEVRLSVLYIETQK